VRGVLQNARYNLALAYLAAGRTSEVLELLRTVVVAAAAQGNPSAGGRAHEGLAQASALEGEVDAALDHARQALELFRTLGSSRDFRFTLVIVGNLLRSLALRDRWVGFLKKSDARTFLKESAADAGTDTTLARLDAWATGLAPRGSNADSVSTGESLSPEESLDRRLWVAEALAESGDRRALAETMPGLWQVLSAWPYFDARLRVLRLQLLAEGDLSPARRAEVLRLLSRSLGGIWGLRLLCLLWEREPAQTRARTLRQRALWAIYSVHAHSPEWAWERVAALPEVRAVLRGFRAKG
jgi:tetratricopeptide (TPR) repeat protein